MNIELAPGQHPIDLFLAWVAQARAAGAPRPLAMALATASPQGAPSVRMVIARKVEHNGITFYTDARSAKGRDLAANPRAAASFYWPELSRSVRVSGRIETVPTAQAAEFFAGYALAVKRAMRASIQSAPLADRKDLERAVAADVDAHPDGGPVAPGFTGYRLAPEQIEFWAEAPDALHDRLLFTASGGQWIAGALQP